MKSPLLRDLPPDWFTLALIKPNALEHRQIIMKEINLRGFVVHALRYVQLEEEDVRYLYVAHVDKPYFQAHMEFMTSGPVVAMVLYRFEALNGWRKLMGETDPSKAKPGTLRARFGNPNVLRENAVHGSDSPEAALREAEYLFPYEAP